MCTLRWKQIKKYYFSSQNTFFIPKKILFSFVRGWHLCLESTLAPSYNGPCLVGRSTGSFCACFHLEYHYLQAEENVNLQHIFENLLCFLPCKTILLGETLVRAALIASVCSCLFLGGGGRDDTLVPVIERVLAP